MEFIQINEVGPRDGLQSSDVMLSVEEKIHSNKST